MNWNVGCETLDERQDASPKAKQQQLTTSFENSENPKVVLCLPSVLSPRVGTLEPRTSEEHHPSSHDKDFETRVEQPPLKPRTDLKR